MKVVPLNGPEANVREKAELERIIREALSSKGSAKIHINFYIPEFNRKIKEVLRGMNYSASVNASMVPHQMTNYHVKLTDIRPIGGDKNQQPEGSAKNTAEHRQAGSSERKSSEVPRWPNKDRIPVNQLSAPSRRVSPPVDKHFTTQVEDVISNVRKATQTEEPLQKEPQISAEEKIRSFEERESTLHAKLDAARVLREKDTMDGIYADLAKLSEERVLIGRLKAEMRARADAANKKKGRVKVKVALEKFPKQPKKSPAMREVVVQKAQDPAVQAPPTRKVITPDGKTIDYRIVERPDGKKVMESLDGKLHGTPYLFTNKAYPGVILSEKAQWTKIKKDVTLNLLEKMHSTGERGSINSAQMNSIREHGFNGMPQEKRGRKTRP